MAVYVVVVVLFSSNVSTFSLPTWDFAGLVVYMLLLLLIYWIDIMHVFFL